VNLDAFLIPFLLLNFFLLILFWFEICFFRLLKVWLLTKGDRCVRELFLLRTWANYRILSVHFFYLCLLFFEIKLLYWSEIVISVAFFEIKLLYWSEIVISVAGIKVVGIERELVVVGKKRVIEVVHWYFLVLYCWWCHNGIWSVIFKTNFKRCSNSYSRSLFLGKYFVK